MRALGLGAASCMVGITPRVEAPSILSAILLDMPSERKWSITPLMAGHPLGEHDSFDRTAEHFITQPEEHEARGWDDVLPLDDEPELRPQRGSIDKVPRRRGAVVAVVALCVCLVSAATAGGFAIFMKGRVRPPNPIPPATPPQANTAPISPVLAPSPAPPQTPAAVPLATQALAIPALAIPSSVPRPPEKVEPATPLPDVEGQERLRKDALATRRRRLHSQPRDNYVWSEKLNALVPF